MQTGCNYWASHAAINMWVDWRIDIVEKDLAAIASQGMTRLRVFPLWRDFQPLETKFGVGGIPKHLVYKGKTVSGSGVDPVMLDHLGELLDAAQKYHLLVHVPLITGWMSGELFVPPAFQGKGVVTDPLAVRWELAMIREIVGRFKDHPAVCSWSPGNECNCMERGTSREQFYLWCRTIADAIRAIDRKHPVYAGMHGLRPVPAGDFSTRVHTSIQDIGEIFDALTVHPYPLFTPYCQTSRPDSFRNCFHAAAESTFYSTISGKPCFVEEYGTFTRMFLGEQEKESYLRASLWNSWAAGCNEFLWWCACSHTFAHVTPYIWSTNERELGMLDEQGNPCSFAQVFRTFNSVMKKIPVWQSEKPDAVCVLSRNQDSWKNAFGCYLIAKQAGLNLSFAGYGEELPEANFYIVPGLTGDTCLYQDEYETLLKRAKAGAKVLFTLRDGVLSPSDSYWGFIPHYLENEPKQVLVTGDGFAFPAARVKHYRIDAGTSRVLASADGEPVCFEQQYGTGSIVLLTVPVEEFAAEDLQAIHHPEAFQAYRFYRKLATGFVQEKALCSADPQCTVSLKKLSETKILAVVVNNGLQNRQNVLNVKPGWKISELLYGDISNLPHHDACVFIMEKNHETDDGYKK